MCALPTLREKGGITRQARETEYDQQVTKQTKTKQNYKEAMWLI